MADIVNLNDRRKLKARKQKETDASAKRALFGRTKGEKSRDEQTRSADIRKLDGAKIESVRRDRDDDKKS